MSEPTARPRPVYVVCAEAPPDVVGGLGRYAERMMAAMRQLGTPVEVFGATARHGAPRTERIGDVTLHRVRTPGGDRAGGGTRTPAALLRVARVIGVLVFNVRVAARILRAGAGPSGSVVAVHDWMGCVAGILCRVLARTPVVFHVHTRELNAAPSRRRSAVASGIAALETAQARMARLIVVPSAGMRDELAASGWPADRLRVIPHGFEDPELSRLAALTGDERDRLREAVRRRYLPGGGGRLVVFAGRLSPHKGVRTLVRAAPLIAGDRDDVRIVLVGAQAPRTGENAEVARLIDETGVGRHVVAGYRFLSSAEVFAHFLAADVCAFPSTYEPFGLVAIEAMALARPVVVGPGYSPEVVGDGAIRCERDSPEELAGALLRCLDDPPAASRLGGRGAAHVRERYTWARTAELTLAAYAELAR
ncbi:glycosyltransferase family 4 protein [Sphaerisporangium sp. TRM90804]|uniref:glycosyltransferase family 4 protein n=1 Tax=Sphaerisporangium sp. TRM90804 TaxID=3031113 RepID=UPI002448D61C|nr:glycosyltransferase family 4 protein [Sphaerisporangium sp. TRM90804]MDH2425629.1 glycosyltransferase family 4 protein [Sphaerisporangium sp. TRM90804]